MDILAYEIQIAVEDLKEIPDALLKDSFLSAVANAGGFLPGNGAIISAYRELRGDKFEAAARAIREENTKHYLSIPFVKRTPEEIKQIENLCKL